MTLTRPQGESLDRLAQLYACERIPPKRLWWTLWLFKSKPESDEALRARCLQVIANVNAKAERDWRDGWWRT